MKDIDQERILYNTHFNSGVINKKLDSKLVLIGLTCFLTNKLKQKKPDITYEQVIKSLTKGMNITDVLLTTWCLLCEDLSYGCDEFPDFGIKPGDMKATIQELIKDWLPF